jgi:hypothetical protein
MCPDPHHATQLLNERQTRSTNEPSKRAALGRLPASFRRHDLPHLLREIAGAYRLLHASLRAQTDRHSEIVGPVADAADGNDGQARALDEERSNELDPIHLRHHHVGHNGVNSLRAESLHGVAAMNRGHHTKGSAFEHAAQQIAHRLVVIDDEDGGLRP